MDLQNSQILQMKSDILVELRTALLRQVSVY